MCFTQDQIGLLNETKFKKKKQYSEDKPYRVRQLLSRVARLLALPV